MRWGTYLWTANAAGWCVLAYLTQIELAWVVAGGCIMAAVIWRTVYDR